MESYDPDRAPQASEWLAMNEDERIQLVLAYHRRIRSKPPNVWLHAAIHAVVETQIAMNLPAARALARLRA